MRSTTSALLLILALGSTGCRSYGGGGSETATVVTIERAVAWGDEERSRLSIDVMAFNEATDRMPFLEDLAPRLDALSASLTGKMSDWRARAAAVDRTTSYRALNHVLGSIVAERQRYEDRYRRFVADLASTLDGGSARPRGDARYQVAPAYYAQLEGRLADVRIRDLIPMAE